ncbi:hypothetical protein [Anaerorhabdus sp.]|uniref:hypothetical protein n=1 Tax=Anaerorhabdus sp. TaxID=1872524 RepID=UPI002FCA723E
MTTENFTFLANQASTKQLFYVWSIISLITHYLLLYKLNKKLLINMNMINLTFITMFIATLIPYKNGISFIAFLHVAFGYLSFILYNYDLLLIYTRLKSFNPNFVQLIFNLYIFMLSICFAIFMFYGSINGLCEIIFCCSTPILLSLYIIKVAEATHY